MCMAVPGIPTNSGKGSPSALYRATLPVGGTPLLMTSEQAPAPVEGWHTPGSQLIRIGVDTAPTRERQHRAPPRRRPPLPAVRPAGPGGWRRPGRLHAPEAARTGPVSASRPFSRTYAQGGCRLNGKWPLTGFLAGESPNQTWGAMLTDLNGLKAVKQIAAINGPQRP